MVHKNWLCNAQKNCNSKKAAGHLWRFLLVNYKFRIVFRVWSVKLDLGKLHINFCEHSTTLVLLGLERLDVKLFLVKLRVIVGLRMF